MEPSVGPAGSRPALGWRVEGKIALEDRDEVQHIKSGRTGHGPCIETPPVSPAIKAITADNEF
jgi:hypothetical protein